jgi:hypothetical protein
VALRAGFGLLGVAVATALAYAAYFAVTVAVSFWAELDRGERGRYVLMLALAAVPTVASAIWLEHLWPGAGADPGNVALRSAAVVAVWGLSAGAGWRLGSWHRAVRKVGEGSHAEAQRREGE